MLKNRDSLTVALDLLTSSFVPILLKISVNSMILRGMEQSFYMEKTDSLFTKLVGLVSFSNVSQEFFVTEQLRQNSKPQSYRVIPQAIAKAYFKNNTETETANNI